jgi:hypothetical protein
MSEGYHAKTPAGCWIATMMAVLLIIFYSHFLKLSSAVKATEYPIGPSFFDHVRNSLVIRPRPSSIDQLPSPIGCATQPIRDAPFRAQVAF